MSDKNLILIGNPGTGKSTLLNALLLNKGFEGGAKFHSGMAECTGVTTQIQYFTYKGTNYGDTPGLNDSEKMAQAAKEIKAGLMQDGYYKIFFIVREHSGRVDPTDALTIEITMNALADISPRVEYQVVYNQINKKVYGNIKKNHELENKFKNQFNNPYGPLDTLFIKRDDDIECEDDALYKISYIEAKFFNDAKSSQIPQEKVQCLQIDKWKQRVDELNKQLNVIKEEYQGKIDEQNIKFQNLELKNQKDKEDFQKRLDLKDKEDDKRLLTQKQEMEQMKLAQQNKIEQMNLNQEQIKKDHDINLKNLEKEQKIGIEKQDKKDKNHQDEMNKLKIKFEEENKNQHKKDQKHQDEMNKLKIKFEEENKNQEINQLKLDKMIKLQERQQEENERMKKEQLKRDEEKRALAKENENLKDRKKLCKDTIASISYHLRTHTNGPARSELGIGLGELENMMNKLDDTDLVTEIREIKGGNILGTIFSLGISAGRITRAICYQRKYFGQKTEQVEIGDIGQKASGSDTTYVTTTDRTFNF